MTDPVSFSSTTSRYALPLLFAAQSQKEFYVNEAHAILDCLLHPAIEGEADSAPATPVEGEVWLVGATPTGDWSGHAGKLACYEAGAWLFIAPRNGLCVLDTGAGQKRFYRDGWQMAVSVVSPSGGSVIDIEARSAVEGLIAALVANGTLPQS